jgi:hypothetical protein
VRAKLFHADGREDITKQLVVFRNFAEVPKNSSDPTNGWKFSALHNTSNVMFCVKLTAEWIFDLKKRASGTQEVVMSILKLNGITDNSFF